MSFISVRSIFSTSARAFVSIFMVVDLLAVLAISFRCGDGAVGAATDLSGDILVVGYIGGC